MKFLKTNVLLKLFFVILLFSFFVWQFAIPSFEKYLYSGNLGDKTKVYRNQEDTPSVTFCALKKTELGWKSAKMKNHVKLIESYCSNATTVTETMDCIDMKTFNLTETIPPFNSTEVDFGETDDQQWRPDISSLHYGTYPCL